MPSRSIARRSSSRTWAAEYNLRAMSFIAPSIETPQTHLAAELPEKIRLWARELGFADAGVASLELDEDLAHLRRGLDEGRNGGMAFMARDLALRRDPTRLRPGTLGVISARLDYRPDAEAADAKAREDELYRKIGRLEMELDWLKKKAGELER